MLLTATISVAQDGRPSFIYGTTPDSSVAHWIRLIVLGNRNSPFPIVWLSPQRFKTSGFPEFLVLLSHQKYDVVGNFTQTRIARSDCARKEPQRPPWYTVEISEYVDGRTQMCVIPQASACRFLSGILELPSLNLDAEERKPIDDLARSIKCKGG